MKIEIAIGIAIETGKSGLSHEDSHFDFDPDGDGSR